MEVVGAPAGNNALPDGVTLPPDDVPILLAAIASDATHLLSGDRKAFGRYDGGVVGGVLIQRPAEYLASRTD